MKTKTPLPLNTSYAHVAEIAERTRKQATKKNAIAELEGCALIARHVEALTLLAVRAARQDGESWTTIGAALGMTKQAAQQRFASATRVSDDDTTDETTMPAHVEDAVSSAIATEVTDRQTHVMEHETPPPCDWSTMPGYSTGYECGEPATARTSYRAGSSIVRQDRCDLHAMPLEDYITVETTWAPATTAPASDETTSALALVRAAATIRQHNADNAERAKNNTLTGAHIDYVLGLDDDLTAGCEAFRARYYPRRHRIIATGTGVFSVSLTGQSKMIAEFDADTVATGALTAEADPRP